MDYTKGDIINKKGIKFKGTSQLDFRLTGHPIVILKDTSFEDDYIYYLTMSSQVHNINSEPDRYYQVNKDVCNKLKKMSMDFGFYTNACSFPNFIIIHK